MKKLAKENWLVHQKYQTILRQTYTIAFEFNLQSGGHFVSPFISEMLAGNYDDRQLSRIMLEDGVLHPDDTPKMTAFRDEAAEKVSLKTQKKRATGLRKTFPQFHRSFS